MRTASASEVVPAACPNRVAACACSSEASRRISMEGEGAAEEVSWAAFVTCA